jgi:anti-sigma B factor antagonist
MLSDRRIPEPDELVVAVHERGTTSVVEVSGELDIATSPMLEERLVTAMLEEPETLVIDLSTVGFMDSTAVELLVRVAARAQGHGVRLLVIQPAGPAAMVLEVCRLRDHLPIIDGPSVGFGTS